MTGGIYWLASYPKSGNTWFRAFLRNLLDDGARPADINELETGEIASSRAWVDDVLGFDTADLTPEEVERLRPAVYGWALRGSEPSYHKIHDAYTYTVGGEPLVGREATRGALYIVRNPLDVAISQANHCGIDVDRSIALLSDEGHRLGQRRKGLPNQLTQRLLSWSRHVKSWVDAEDLRCEVVRYEDMLHDPRATFQRACRSLALPEDPARIEKAIRFSAFGELSAQEARKRFRERPGRAPEPFFRRGRAGGWRGTLTPDQVDRVVRDHGEVMQRFGYLDERGDPR